MLEWRADQTYHKNRVHSTGDGRGEDLADLETNEEAKSHNHGRELVVGVIRRIRKVNVEVTGKVIQTRRTNGCDGVLRKQGTSICDKGRPRSKHRT